MTEDLAASSDLPMTSTDDDVGNASGPEADSPTAMNPRTRLALLALLILIAGGVIWGTNRSRTPEPPLVVPRLTNGPEFSKDARSDGRVIPQKVWVAHAKSNLLEVRVYDKPNGALQRQDTVGDGALHDVTIPRPTRLGEDPVFLVKTPNVSGFHEVYLPERPNESTGFVSASDVDLELSTKRIVVDLSDRKVRMYSGGAQIFEFDVAVGRPETPTPTGLFFVQIATQNPDPTGTYGSYTLALSGYSDAIKATKEFENGLIAIHGTNQPELIGQEVSHGCVRVTDEAIRKIVDEGVPLGTPVEIFP